MELAKRGNTVKQIADRMGLSYDLVRRQVERAEERGDLPRGTLGKLVTPKKPKPKTKTDEAEHEAEPACAKISVFAPQRRVAAELGRCSCCQGLTEVAVGVNGTSFRLCRPCGNVLHAGLGKALGDALEMRRRFNQISIR